MNIELARRALACKHWRWMPGMRTVRDDGHRFHIGCTVAASKVKPEWLPDLTDPATLGCLLALVREAWGDNTASTAATRELDKKTGWIMDCWNPQSPLNKIGPFKTEVEALIAALEASL
jgi:hypothetical protein